MKTRYRPEIDGLRAVAVLSVVVFHAFPSALPGGFVGVDIFFVISGYVIKRLLDAEWRAAGSIDILAFYARRVRRIFPALILTIVTTLAASMLLLDGTAEMQAVANSAAASLLFAANWYFQQHTGGYFDPLTDRLPLLHLWSLGVEEQFYMFWPLALAFILRRRPAMLFKVMLATAGASALLAVVLCVIDPNMAFYMMPARFWELALGGLIAIGPRDTAHPCRMAIGGIALVLVALCMPTQRLQAMNVVIAAAGAGLLLRAVHAEADLGAVGRSLRSRPAIWFGLISFSLYLWHWPLLALARTMNPGGTPIRIRLAICLVSVGFAWISFRFIESPFRKPNPATPNGKLLFAGVFATSALAYASVVIAGEIAIPMHRDNPLAAATAQDYPADPLRCHHGTLDSVDDFPRAECTYRGWRGGPERVVIWGDSRAYAWQPLAHALADRLGTPAVSFTRDSCPPAIDFDNGNGLSSSSSCRAFNAHAAQSLNASDTVVMVAMWPGDPDERDFKKKLGFTLAQVSPRVRHIVLLGPTPILRDAVPACIAAKAPEACAITRAAFAAQSERTGHALAELAARFANVEYVDPAGFFCDARTCPALKDGYGLYWDAHHIASRAARAFASEYLDRAP